MEGKDGSNTKGPWHNTVCEVKYELSWNSTGELSQALLPFGLNSLVGFVLTVT